VSDKSVGIQFHDRLDIDLPNGFTAGKLYFNVHFRIKTPTYNRNGWLSNESRDAFNNDAYSFFESLGFTGTKSVSSSVGSRLFIDGGYIHLHPNDFEGYLTLIEINRVKAALENFSGGVFKLSWIDVYEPRENISEEEISVRVTLSLAAIQNVLIEKLKTPRSNLWHEVESWLVYTKRIDGFRFYDSANKDRSHREILDLLVSQIARGLVEDGRLKSFENANGKVMFRSANSKELKALKHEQSPLELTV
jgi:hypothetical protein